MLIAGGAGFIGSIAAQEFVRSGWRVTILDGFLPGTGGKLAHLNSINGSVELVARRIERVGDLPKLLAAQDLIVDCMGMTSHPAGLQNPVRDLRMNAESHLHLIGALPKGRGPTIIYLGTRVQYGSPHVRRITEATPAQPSDPQGVSKSAAEGYYRAYSGLYGWDVVSLRVANCFGEHQPSRGRDLGLVGNCIRSLIAHGTVVVYGRARRRNLVYVRDLAQMLLSLGSRPPAGFNVLNVAGMPVKIEEMAGHLIAIIGQGRIVNQELPRDLRLFEGGAAHFDDTAIRRLIKPFPHTDLKVGLERTVEYLREAGR